MKVGSDGNLGLSREYPEKLFGPLFYSLWNCPLSLLMPHTHTSICGNITLSEPCIYLCEIIKFLKIFASLCFGRK